MGVDWRTLGWAEYQMLLVGWNENHRDKKDDPKAPPDFERLRTVMAAHTSVQ